MGTSIGHSKGISSVESLMDCTVMRIALKVF